MSNIDLQTILGDWKGQDREDREGENGGIGGEEEGEAGQRRGGNRVI